MATAELNGTPVPDTKVTKAKKAAVEKSETIGIPKPDKRVMPVTVKGKTPLIVHKFSEKARKQMAEKQAGAARMKKAPKVPEEEFRNALYVFRDNPKKYGLPAVSFKKAMVNACRHVDGMPMTVARGAFHVYGDGKGEDGRDLVEIHGSEPVMRTDMVRLESGVADIRYRPEFTDWQCHLRIEFLNTSITVAEVANLLNVAGFAVGVGENRPEKSGDTCGQFEVVMSAEA
jgi:hypothetical protein